MMAVESSFKNMLLCLGTITLVCGILLASVYVITKEPIEKASDERLKQTIAAVSPAFDSLELVKTDSLEYYVSRCSDGQVVCYILNGASAGYGGRISLMVGICPDGSIYKTSVLQHSETPGLGAKCTDESFASQFRKFDVIGGSLSVCKDGGDIDAIQGATITSRAYCAAVGNAVDIFKKICPPAPVQADTLSHTQIDGGYSNE